MKLLFLSHHWMSNSHHSRHSGFQRLVSEAAKHHDVTLITWGSKASAHKDETGITVMMIKAKKRDFLFKKRMDISRLGKKIAGNFDVVHSLYSDCTFHLAPESYLVTFHVLPEVTEYSDWKQKIFIQLKYRLLQKRAMKRSKRLICVSNNLLQHIPEAYQYKSQFIPHGVDTDFWDPSLCTNVISPKPKPFILCLGAHGADIPQLREFIEQNPDMLFVIVGMESELARYTNVERLTNISDEALRDLYLHSLAVLKPLVFATANNSILETLSMGKTVITSRIAGVTDYVDDSVCLFIDRLHGRDLSTIASLVITAETIRAYAVKNFSWKVILERYIRCYTDKPSVADNG